MILYDCFFLLHIFNPGAASIVSHYRVPIMEIIDMEITRHWAYKFYDTQQHSISSSGRIVPV